MAKQQTLINIILDFSFEWNKLSTEGYNFKEFQAAIVIQMYMKLMGLPSWEVSREQLSC